MSNVVKAKKANGDKQVFSRQVWENLPGDKYGWTEDNDTPKVPDEIKTLLKVHIPTEGAPLQMATPKQPAKRGRKNKV